MSFLKTALTTLAGALAFAGAAFAGEINIAKGETYALQGYDTVAYHTVGEATEGDTAYTAQYKGETWLFASADNRDLFKAEPAKYAPAYGGHCAFGASVNRLFDGDPEAWQIVDGQLYVNKDKGILKRWQKDIPGNLEKSEANWPGLRAELVADASPALGGGS
ncbi:MAG: YHS domain-containing (seleno)protein [Maricaulaceae bacterium]